MIEEKFQQNTDTETIVQLVTGGDGDVLDWNIAWKLWMIIQERWEGGRFEFAGVDDAGCGLRSVSCISNSHLFHSFIVCVKAILESHVYEVHSYYKECFDIRPIPEIRFLLFCTWTIGFSLFVPVPFIISSAAPRVLSPSVFCSPSVMRRSNIRETIEIYAEPTSMVDTCFAFGIWWRILRCIIMYQLLNIITSTIFWIFWILCISADSNFP